MSLFHLLAMHPSPSIPKESVMGSVNLCLREGSNFLSLLQTRENDAVCSQVERG